MCKTAGQQIGTQLIFYSCITLQVYCIWEDGNRGTWYTVTYDGGIRTVNKGCGPAGFSRSSGWFIRRSREVAERAARFQGSSLSPQLQWQAALHWLLQHTATKNSAKKLCCWEASGQPVSRQTGCHRCHLVGDTNHYMPQPHTTTQDLFQVILLFDPLLPWTKTSRAWPSLWFLCLWSSHLITPVVLPPPPP